MKKYETLDGTPIETDEDGYQITPEGFFYGPAGLSELAEIGWIRERKMTFQDLATELDYTYPRSIRHDSPTGQLLQRIIDKGLVDQILADD